MQLVQYFEERRQIYRLSRELASTRRFYERHITEARKRRAPRAEIEQLYDEMRLQTEVTDLELDRLITIRLRRVADRLLLTLPKYEDKEVWEKENPLNYLILTHEGMKSVRRSIRQARREAAEYFLKWVVPMIGIIGALTGLIAVWKR